jgi:hypothetical protein
MTSRRLTIGRSAALNESGRHMVRLAISRHACNPCTSILVTANECPAHRRLLGRDAIHEPISDK